MKLSLILLIALFTFNLMAKQIICTTRILNQKLDKSPKVTWCGAIQVPARNGGVKYRRVPKSCKKYSVEFFSIRENDAKYSEHCKSINSPSCYLIRIRDAGTRMGMMGLKSHLIVRNTNELPARFSLSASGIGRNRRVGVGRLYIMDLNCIVR